MNLHGKTNRAKPLAQIFCDGACSNSGTRAYFGGWASILVRGDREDIYSGNHYPATNNTMELQALIGGLDALGDEPYIVEFFSDARYVVDGFNLWLKNWIRRDWRTSGGDEAANQDHWRKVAEHTVLHDIHGNWIRGHVAQADRSLYQEYNARCDELAVQEAWNGFRIARGDKANV